VTLLLVVGGMDVGGDVHDGMEVKSKLGWGCGCCVIGCGIAGAKGCTREMVVSLEQPGVKIYVTPPIMRGTKS
jgi:hypothetical protein